MDGLWESQRIRVQFEVGPSAVLLTTTLATAALAASLLLSFHNGRQLAPNRELNPAPLNTLSLVNQSNPTSRELRNSTPSRRHWYRPRGSCVDAPTVKRMRRRPYAIRRSIFVYWRTVCRNSSGPPAQTGGSITQMLTENFAAGVSRTDWETIIHPDDRRATAEAWLRSSEAGTPYEKEHRLLVGGNDYRWHLSRAAPLLDSSGAVVRWYGTTTDINEHKVREERIRSLIGEVNHRSRNLLTVAQSIARQSVRHGETALEFEQKYSRRLMALTASQDLLTERQWVGVAVESLVRVQTRSANQSTARSIAISGPQLICVLRRRRPSEM